VFDSEDSLERVEDDLLADVAGTFADGANASGRLIKAMALHWSLVPRIKAWSLTSTLWHSIIWAQTLRRVWHTYDALAASKRLASTRLFPSKMGPLRRRSRKDLMDMCSRSESRKARCSMTLDEPVSGLVQSCITWIGFAGPDPCVLSKPTRKAFRNRHTHDRIAHEPIMESILNDLLSDSAPTT
jgi:hypothetical protein